MEYAEYNLDDMMHTLAQRDDIHGRMARTCNVAELQTLRGIIMAVNMPDEPVADIAKYWVTLDSRLRSPIAVSMLSLIVMEIAEASASRTLPLIERLYRAYDLMK